MVCSFFGHRDVQVKLEEKIEENVVRLITKYGVNTFLVGNQGNFDYVVQKVLKKVKGKFPEIECDVVLARLPGKVKKSPLEHPTIFPAILENVPPKFAVDRRNHWMVEKSDFVITYTKSPTGGAAKFQRLAQQKGKKVINLAESE